MHGPEIRAEALQLVAAGVNDCEIARRLGIARTTVRDWRRPRYVPKTPRGVVRVCPRCWRPSTPISFTAGDYAELLGLYLGDGYINRLARCQRLRLFLDARYARIVYETEELLTRSFPVNPVRRVSFHEGAEVVLDLYNQHLVCLFPQHGVGRKHTRAIALEEWQQEIVDQAPWAFLRGCIRSDGCAFVNRTGRYEYLSYGFANLSTEILDLFERTCRGLGMRPRRYETAIRLNRREDARRLLEHVGLKS
jgi:hypothetical protein